MTLSRAQHNTTAKVYSYDGSYTKSEIRRRDEAAYGAQPCRFACRHCDWTLDAPAAVGLVAAREHRLSHGFTGRKRRRR